MTFRVPWQSLPKDDIKKLAEAVEQNFDDVTGAISAPTFRRLYIATEESTTSAAYTTLTTPDQVLNVPVPQGGFICVAYQAMWKETARMAARAAIFLNSTQLKVAVSGTASPATSAAMIDSNFSIASQYALLASSQVGLVGGSDDSGATAYGGDVATGQAVGIQGGPTGTTDSLAVDVGGNFTIVHDAFWGGACVIFAAPGTYTVGVRFKTSSGTVTAKERKLAVWTVGAASGSAF